MKSKKKMVDVIMIIKKKVHHPNDVSVKYFQATEAKKLFDYFKLPGKFVKNYSPRVVKRDGSELEMDWLILVDPDNKELFERILINIEFQTQRVDMRKIKVISDYKDYSKTNFGFPVLTIIIIFDEREFEASLKEYAITASDIFKPVYIHRPWKVIEKRLNNLEIKIQNNEKLSQDEAFDIAFLPIFSPKQKAKSVTEKITNIFSNDNTIKEPLRNDIAYVLGIMIRKYFDLTPKGKELLKLIDKEINKSDLMDVIEYELDYRDQAHKAEIKEIIDTKDKEITAKDKEINTKNKENARLKAILIENNIEF